MKDLVWMPTAASICTAQLFSGGLKSFSQEQLYKSAIRGRREDSCKGMGQTKGAAESVREVLRMVSPFGSRNQLRK